MVNKQWFSTSSRLQLEDLKKVYGLVEPVKILNSVLSKKENSEVSSFIKQNVSDFIGHKTLYETTQKKWSTVDSMNEPAEP